MLLTCTYQSAGTIRIPHVLNTFTPLLTSGIWSLYHRMFIIREQNKEFKQTIDCLVFNSKLSGKNLESALTILKSEVISTII